MKKVLIVCNPHSGKGKPVAFAKKLKEEIDKSGLMTAEIFLSQTIVSFQMFLRDNPNFDIAAILGGDGSFSIAVDNFIKLNLDHIPLCAVPLGTVNDFAKQLGIKKDPKQVAKLILDEKITTCDVAKVTDEEESVTYVTNVACGGYFTHGANSYSRRAKKFFGRLAYYSIGIFNSFHLKGQMLKFTVDGECFEEKTAMFLILNSKSAGGFKKIAIQSELDDGCFDLVVYRRRNIVSMFGTFLKMMRGKHTNDKNILYVKGSKFKVELSGEKINPKFKKSDLDGNVGPELPINIEVLCKKIKVFKV